MAAKRTSLRFSKMHGAGNDFVVLDLRDNAALALRVSNNATDFCHALADRHTGIGCDQILTIEPARSDQAIASYRIWNADGSYAQQCGNGARCVAAWLVRDLDHALMSAHGEVVEPSFDRLRMSVLRQAQDERVFGHLRVSAKEPAHGEPVEPCFEAEVKRDGNTFFLDSPSGTHAVKHQEDGQFRIAMGVPQFAPQTLPLAGFQEAQDEYALVLHGADDMELRFGAVSMGNPHALIEVDAIDDAPVAALGTALQRDPAFPESVNVGFAQIDARDRIRLRVYERGVGETLACGSGACAAAAILMRRGRIDRDVIVALPGGELRIGWHDDSAPITMSGSATFVFEGELCA